MRHDRAPIAALMTTLAALSFAQGLLGQFVAQAIPLFLRDAGASSGQIAWIYLAAVPFVLRFVWGPLVDRTAGAARAGYGPWIVVTQVIACLCLAALCLVEPRAALPLLTVLCAAMMLAVGSQQVATGGWMVALLPPDRHARGPSVQAAASALAGLVLGGGILAGLGDLGWAPVVAAVLMVSGLVLLVPLVGAPLSIPVQAGARRPGLRSQFTLFRDRRARRLFGLAVFTGAACVIPYALKGVLLVDAGYTIAEAGLIGIVLGNIAGLVAALAARPLTDRFGGYAVLCGLGIAAALVLVAFLATAGIATLPVRAAGLVTAANALIFAGFTAERALLIPLCAKARRATDYAVFTSLEALAAVVVGGAALALLDRAGLETVLAAGAFLSLFAAALAAREVRAQRLPKEVPTSCHPR